MKKIKNIFVLCLTICIVLLSLSGCSFSNTKEIEKEGQVEITMYTTDECPETYTIKFDKKIISSAIDDIMICAYQYNDNYVAMYTYSGNTVWIDEDKDGYETVFNGRFVIREKN